MKEIIDIYEHQICLIMDNSAVHWSKDSTCYLKETRWSCFFLLQYAPELAPVELFFWQLIRLISSSRPQAVMNVEKKSGIRQLSEIINSIDRFTIVKTWSHFLQILKETLGDLATIFNFST